MRALCMKQSMCNPACPATIWGLASEQVCVHAACREIPPLPWYRQTVPQMVMAGFLPFSAIYIELYYIFASVWGHKVCAPLLPLAQRLQHSPLDGAAWLIFCGRNVSNRKRV